uniref:Ribonuclease H1 n=1 Tax=Phallusia mammillata TaxID=59560 RepID=A0A6F9DRI9_9ASCI|nr:ribonuclease H1-like [Phallusia mammillata]
MYRLGMVSFYAVHVGRKQGVFNTWSECESLVKGFKGARYKKFATLAAAQNFSKFGSETKQANKLGTHIPTINAITRGKRKLAPVASQHTKRLKTSVDGEKDLNNTNEHSDSKIVYTDGACSGNGKKNCQAGYGVWWGPDHPLNLSCKLKGIQTNQRAEIAAINACIKQAKENGFKKLLVRTDSMFVINCVTKWVHGWKKRNWIKADGKPVIHKKEFLEILSNMNDVRVTFEHVYGHKGEVGNEMADRLAVQGIGKSL